VERREGCFRGLRQSVDEGGEEREEGVNDFGGRGEGERG